jgi:CBS domain-containing protein
MARAVQAPGAEVRVELAKDAMTPDPITMRHTDTVEACALIFRQHGFRHLPIVDARGGLAGMITTHRVEGRSAGEDLASLLQPVDVVCAAEDPLAPIMRALARTSQDVAVVVDGDQRPVGVITEHDAMVYASLVLSDDVRVQHVRPRDVGQIDPQRRAHVAMLEMISQRIHHLVVVDDGAMVGVLSYGDLLRAGAHHARDVLVDDVIRRRDVISARDGDSVREAARLMAVHHIGCVPILGPDDFPVRVVTRTDVLEVLSAALDVEQAVGR